MMNDNRSTSSTMFPAQTIDSEDSYLTDIDVDDTSDLDCSASVVAGNVSELSVSKLAEVHRQTMNSAENSRSFENTASMLSLDPEGSSPGRPRLITTMSGVQPDPRGMDVLPPLRMPPTSSRQPTLAREVSLKFDTLRFSVKQRATPNKPVVSASLLERENLQQWICEWGSCRAWMQDFVNAVLMPVTQNSWPSSASAPSVATFHVSFRGTYHLPSDYLRSRQAAGGSPSVSSPTALNVDRVRLVPSTNMRLERGRRGTSSTGRSGDGGLSHRSHSRQQLPQPEVIGSRGINHWYASGTLSSESAGDTNSQRGGAKEKFRISV